MNAVQKRMAARRQTVRDMYTQDIAVSAIAEGLAVSQQTVYQDLRALGLREKGEYTSFHREAISKGVQKKRAVEKVMRAGSVFCCVCGKLADKRPYRKRHYCDIHLETAGDHDPEYMNKKRAAAGDRVASHGRLE